MFIRILIKIIFLVIIAFQSFECFASVSTLNRINVRPLNRAIIYFDVLPDAYSSKLSDDKRTIYIELPKIEVVDSCRQIVSGGIIKSVQVQTLKEKALITLMLKERRGYNAVILPYSKAIMVEVFNWNELTQADDKFRTSLLAYEDGIFSEALNDLLNVAKLKHANASVFAGMILLKNGQIQSAINLLKTATELNSDINDRYAALYHAYMILDNRIEAEKYLDEFKKNSGVAAPGIWEINLSTDVDSSLIALTDSLRNSFTASVANLDTFNSEIEFPDEVTVDTLTTSQSNEFSMNSYLFELIALISIAIFVSLLYFYLKWKNTRQKAISKQKSDAFAESLKTAEVKGKPSKVTDLYKQNEQTKPEKTSNIKNEENKEIIKGVEQILKDAEDKKFQKTKVDKDKTLQNPKPKGNPKVELAMHLIEEQRKIKSSVLSNIKTDEMPHDPEKLSEYAKKLGIERGGLETKQAIERLLSDEDYFKTISKKFRNESND